MKVLFKTATLFILVSLLSTGCQKHDCQKPKSDLTDGIITGNDARACACCGGLMITFSNNPNTYAEKFYDIVQMPANSGISETTTFPVYVKVKCDSTTVSCPNQVKILKLERR